MQTREDILALMRGLFEEMFETNPDDVRLEAHLGDDLDIDSIDAVDLIARLRSLTGRKIEPEQFKSVRTVADVVESVFRLVNE